MKVLCIGHSCYDIIMPVEKYPVENTENRLKEQIECPGGPALNAAMLLGKWDIETYLVSVVGNDRYADIIIDSLNKSNVSTKFIIKRQDSQTTKTFVILNKENASRTLFNISAPKDERYEVNYDFTPDIILMDSEHYNLSAQAIKKFPNAIRIIDAGKLTEQTVALCKVCDYVVCSKEFAELASRERIDYANPDSLKVVMNKLSEQFPGNIIITQEEKGCLYKIEEKIKMMSGIKVNANDTTGAGDIFHGAFAYGIAKKLPLEKCLKIANIAAGVSVKTLGSSISIPDVEEVYKIYEKNR